MVDQLKTREEMDPTYQWDLTLMFESDEDHKKALEEAQTLVSNLKDIEGTLGESADKLAEGLDRVHETQRAVSNVYVYSHLKTDQDSSNATYQTLDALSRQLYADFGAALAFFEPEILAIEPDTLQEYIDGNERLQFYAHAIDNITRGREHVLSPEVELLLAEANPALNASSQTFSLLTNADMTFPKIKDEEGKEVQLSHGSYGRYIESPDRRVRKDAFEEYYSVFDQYQHTLASTLTGEIKSNNFLAKARHFKSAREAALFNNNVPESVYDTLVDSVNNHLNLLHKYVELRRDLLKLDDLQMYDMYTPLLGESPIKITYEEAQRITLEALAPMGEEYLAIIKEAFEEKWIDVYENKGKRSGAYSSGSYDSKPYILMNWQDNLNTLYTLVHELGHSAHSYLSRSNQDFAYGGYPIFLAEIASTTNENLLTAYLLKTHTDRETQLFILNNFLDGVKGTVFRQTQFAEFEHFMYTKDAEGVPLTSEFLNENYQALNHKYYGDAINSDSEIRLEWSRIPHFYYNYYVFQYSTGFAAATFFAEKILSGDQEALEKYLNFLKSGSTQYPIDTMKTAGLDMTQSDYIDATLKVFGERLDEFKALLEDK